MVNRRCCLFSKPGWPTIGGMATPSVKGRQVKLTINVFYDEGTRRVHLTSTDPDLGPKGLHTNLAPGSAADKAMRRILARFGKPC